MSDHGRPKRRVDERQLTMNLTVREGNGCVDLVVVFNVQPENQGKLIQLLQEGAETIIGKQPGYIASSFLKSKDGRRVVGYAQWQNEDDVRAYRTRPEVAEYFKGVRALASFETTLIEVVHVHHVHQTTANL
jgi:heme-degrading monooxygenase HmoA